MRVGVVTTSYPRDEGDPSGHFVRAEVRALERDGHDVTVFAPRGAAFGWPGVAARVRERPWRAAGAALDLAALAADVARAAPFDRIVAHWAVPCAFPVAMGATLARDRAAALFGIGAPGAGRGPRSPACPLAVVSHGGDVRALLALPRAARARIVQAIAARASAWRFVSASLARSLAAALDAKTAGAVEAIASIGASPIELPGVFAESGEVGRGRGEGARDEDRGARAGRGGPRVAVAVGRLVPGKRIDRVIDEVAQGGGLATRLVVVGDGPERRRLEALARARGVDAVFTGLVPRDEALRWIARADVLLHASEAEGASTVVREAEALGTLVRRL